MREALPELAEAVTPADALAVITTYCHSRHGLTYDSRNAYAAHAQGQAFLLSGYLARTSPTAACFDQAAAVQVLGAALGINSTYCLAEPFGYVEETSVMGRLSNSPGAGSVSKKSRDRNFVQSHAFCVLEDGLGRPQVFDATFGPHVGTPLRKYYGAVVASRKRARYRGDQRRGWHKRDIMRTLGVHTLLLAEDVSVGVGPLTRRA